MADFTVVVAVAMVDAWHGSLPGICVLPGSICLIKPDGNVCYHFCYRTPEYWQGLEGTIEFDAYRRTEQNQSPRAGISLFGTFQANCKTVYTSSILVVASIRSLEIPRIRFPGFRFGT